MVSKVNSPVSESFNSETVLNKIIATASFIIPSPKRTALRTGYLSGYARNDLTLMSAIAATVSVAQRTLLIIIISVKLKTLNM